jgi:MFS family permease
MERNIRLYPWFQLTATAYFWMPVFFLYFSRHLTLGEVLLLEAIYYAAVFLLEVPSGWFSDAVGRRITLIIAAVAHIAAYGLFFAGHGLAVFAAAQVCLATGLAFISGTDTALHYDSLHAANRDDELAGREARVAQVASITMAVSAMVGGLVAAVELRYAYGLSFLAAVGMLLIALLFTEPPAPADGERRTFRRQLRRCGAALGRARLRWLFAFALFAYAMNHVPYHLAQPYVDLLLGERAELGDLDSTPIVTGALTAAIMLVRALAAGRSIVLRDRLGLRGVLLLSLSLQVAIITACGAVLHPIVIIALLARSAPSGLQHAPMAAAVVPQVPKSIRATYLSLQTLAGRLVYTLMLLGLALVVGTREPVSWPGISTMALTAAGVGAVVILLLVITSGALDEVTGGGGSREPTE